MPNSSERLEAAIERFCAHMAAENKAQGTIKPHTGVTCDWWPVWPNLSSRGSAAMK